PPPRPRPDGGPGAPRRAPARASPTPCVRDSTKVTNKMPPVGPELISPRSTRVLAARRLAKRNFRGKERLFLAEGPQAVREAAAHRAVGAAREAGARVHLAAEQVVADISTTVTPQGLVGVCRFLDTPFEEILAARPRLVAVLAHVRDPGNAGTVLRSADAAGAEAVVLT